MSQFLLLSTYWTYYLMGIILIPGILLGIYAQFKVSSAYSKYSKIPSSRGKTAGEVARLILDAAGCEDVKIAHINGELTDNYNHSTKTVSLSSSVHSSTSVAAIGIAAHEVGHALQYKTNYALVHVRKVAIITSNITSTLLWPLVILGLVLNFAVMSSFGMIMVWAGISVFGIAALVNLVTLPVEYNASKRAIKILDESGILDEDEVPQAKKVLDAAALTYVAALVVSILNLLRFILAVKASND